MYLQRWNRLRVNHVRGTHFRGSEGSYVVVLRCSSRSRYARVANSSVHTKSPTPKC